VNEHPIPDIREIEALSRRVQHIDASNAELSARMSGIESSVNSLVTAVDRIMDKVSAPPQTTNWQAIIGAMMLVFTLAASYSNLSIGPLRESLTVNTQDLKALNTNISSTAQRMSSLEAQVSALKESIHGRNP
jgi:prefoldin subunit 5